MNDRQIETRVGVEGVYGPYEAKLNPSKLWNGWVSPRFTLDTVRQLANDTQGLAEKDGFDCLETVHVIEGRADSPNSAHVIDGGTDGEGNPRQVIVHVCWPLMDESAERAVNIFGVRPGVHVEHTETCGVGEPRAVVLCVDWPLWRGEDGSAEQVTTVVEPDSEGRYAVGAWKWAWRITRWCCACGQDNYWHVTDCMNCDLTRDTQPEKKPCDCGCRALRKGFARPVTSSASSSPTPARPA